MTKGRSIVEVKKPLRLAFVCNEYPPVPHGGIGTLVRSLGRALVAAGHEVRVIGSYRPDHCGADYEEDQGVRVWRLRSPGWRVGWILARYRVYRQIAVWGHRGEIDVVELPDWEGWAAAWPRLPVPVVVRLNGSATYFAAELGSRATWRTQWFERCSYARADFRCSASRYTADKTPSLFGMPDQPCEVLYNPVELPACPVRDRSRNEVIFTGSLLEKKGIVSLIRAWPGVLKACPEATLQIYGRDTRLPSGDSMSSYLLSQLEPAERATVRFYGHQPYDVLRDALARAALAVFPSYAEAFALAPMEAMACGCPTVFTRRSSGPELIEEGEHGLLVEPDSPAEISAAIIRLLTDRALAERLGMGGRRRIEQRFTLSRIVGDNVKFYRACIAEFHARGARTSAARRASEAPARS